MPPRYLFDASIYKALISLFTTFSPSLKTVLLDQKPYYSTLCSQDLEFKPQYKKDV